MMKNNDFKPQMLIVVLLGCSTLLLSCQNQPIDQSQRKQQSVHYSSEASSATPRSKEYEWMSLADWYHKHANQVAEAKKGQAQVLFIGDSITESWNWGEEQKSIFDQYFGAYRTANFGIGGDQTQNVLWRLQHGLKGQLTPKAIVLLIGVNNFGHSNHSAEEVYNGVKANIDQIKENYPGAKVLLNAIFPYDEFASSPNRLRLAQTNALLFGLADNQHIFYYDSSDVFLNDKGDIPQSLMGDFLHPSAEGLRRYAKKISPIINQWMTAL